MTETQEPRESNLEQANMLVESWQREGHKVIFELRDGSFALGQKPEGQIVNLTFAMDNRYQKELLRDRINAKLNRGEKILTNPKK